MMLDAACPTASVRRGCWMLDTGCWLLVTVFWILDTGFTVLKGRHVKALGKTL